VNMAQPGPLGRSIDDLELLWKIIRGPDLSDFEVAPIDWRPPSGRTLGQLRFAWTDGFEPYFAARRVSLLLFAAEHHGLQGAPWFQPILAAASVTLRSNSTFTLLGAARASVGIAVLPRLIARAHADLVAVSEDLHVGDFWLVTHPDFRRDPNVRKAADFIRREPFGDDTGFESAKGPLP
jgi:DNA-binding transcriptional LysR family regulator